MPELAETISGYVVGDDLEIQRTVTNLPDPMATAWFTVKRHQQEADPGELQKIITTSDSPGVGQITEAGGSGVSGTLRFDFTQADTTALGAHRWVYDIQIKLTTGVVYTLEKGTITFTMDVTKSST